MPPQIRNLSSLLQIQYTRTIPFVISMCTARLRLFAKTLRNPHMRISRTPDQLRVSSNIFSLPRTATQSFLVMSSELISHSYISALIVLSYITSILRYLGLLKTLDKLLYSILVFSDIFDEYC